MFSVCWLFPGYVERVTQSNYAYCAQHAPACRIAADHNSAEGANSVTHVVMLAVFIVSNTFYPAFTQKPQGTLSPTIFEAVFVWNGRLLVFFQNYMINTSSGQILF